MKLVTNIQNLLTEIERRIPDAQKADLNISKSNIAWHLDHSLKVVNGVTGMLVKSDVKDYKSNFNKWRLICFGFNFIPRGRGKAPKVVRPPEIVKVEDIKQQLEQAKSNIDPLKDVPKHANFKHPVFGVLNKKQTLKFIKLHTQHHLKIIDDICR
ncbi:DUF1569 domain-containing protein [uncultured Psychroserpens sp.]|uniref:DUF1569 domain-containing protein n=1 Tax=uncultured Psychroserpens sp. TaxID=255436 RepID=UPI002626431D|nr:DUF1569 domain-containing protein [uncultured Psychroserpens sp.]